jgi:hypothetical protein
MAASAWITHVKKYAKANKIEYGEALKKAAPSYNKMSSPASSTKKINKKKRRKRRKH